MKEFPATETLVAPHHLTFFFFGMVGAMPCSACQSVITAAQASHAQQTRKKERRKIVIVRRVIRH
ncbi:MAG: hypothetical protein JNJ94_02885 [Chlorobi bacterium]|nr:hypothetical protein [Chlorobiota bacterium]